MDKTPNWYPDPQEPGLLRYWTGETWSEHTAPAIAPPIRTPADPRRMSGQALPTPVLMVLVPLAALFVVFVLSAVAAGFAGA